MGAKEAVGAYGERVAVRHLEDAGYAVLATNWRSRAGELDVVATRDGVVVFVEVKTRRSLAFGTPASAVTPLKAARLRLLAQEWLASSPLRATLPAPPVRFDVVSVLRPPSGPAVVEHLEGAF
ncbi:MAG TPA: YraN family protein [Frankiaceae bacterium]|nr:YraN family protein [Frankiaceae bacterium]